MLMRQGAFFFTSDWESGCKNPSITPTWRFPDQLLQLTLEGVKDKKIRDATLASNLPV